MRYRAPLSALALASVVFAASEASAARIVVTITGLKSNEGGVYVGLYATPSKFLNGTQVDAMKKMRASTGPITVAFDNLAPGTYAVGAYHDENNNDHLDARLYRPADRGLRAVEWRPGGHVEADLPASRLHGRQRRRGGLAADPLLRGRKNRGACEERRNSHRHRSRSRQNHAQSWLIFRSQRCNNRVTA